MDGKHIAAGQSVIHLDIVIQLQIAAVFVHIHQHMAGMHTDGHFTIRCTVVGEMALALTKYHLAVHFALTHHGNFLTYDLDHGGGASHTGQFRLR